MSSDPAPAESAESPTPAGMNHPLLVLNSSPSPPHRSIWEATYGRVSGCIDTIYTSVRTLNERRPLLFSVGFGQESLEAVYRIQDSALSRMREGRSPLNEPPLAIEWASENFPLDAGGTSWFCYSRATPSPPSVVAREGSATSPLATLLPPSLQRMRFLYIADARARAPWDGSECAKPLPSSITTILPATGDEDYASRVHMARNIVKEASIRATVGGAPAAVILPIPPFYGVRRAPGQTYAYVSRVGDFSIQSEALMHETCALLVWAHAFSPSARLASAGFSWGAAMCSGAALYAATSLPPGVSAQQLAVVPYVGSASPLPLLEGVLHADIDWPALQRDHESHAAVAQSVKTASIGGAGESAKVSSPSSSLTVEARMRYALNAANLTPFAEALAAFRSSSGSTGGSFGALVSTAMHDDGFVPGHLCSELHAVLGSATPLVAQCFRWFSGGHAVAALSAASRLPSGVLDAFELMPRI